MNYRHAFHAGNFADVVKHAVLALVIEHLKLKDAPFRIIDTHAGRGHYNLAGGPADRTGEWHNGIGRLLGADAVALPDAVAPILAPYLDAVRAENIGDALRTYPGSPRIARALMRPGDRLIVNELHPEDGRALAHLFARDRQTKVMTLDGWTALKALLPPKERRGVVLIDPPFEEPGELIRMTEGLQEAARRFATGVSLLWYPIKDPKPIARFHRALAELGFSRLLVAELSVRRAKSTDQLAGTGIAILNPPFRLEAQLEVLLPFLGRVLGVDGAGDHRILPPAHARQAGS